MSSPVPTEPPETPARPAPDAQESPEGVQEGADTGEGVSEALRAVYVAGPMAGYDDLNRPAFRAAAQVLRETGALVVNPHDVEPHWHRGDCPRSYATNPDGHAAACYLKSALRAMLECSEIHLLPGWESSVGARLELSVAAAVGMRVTFAGGARW